MTTFLLGTSDVHEAAALCDYLGERLDSDDVVHVVGLETGAGAGGNDPPSAGPLGGNAAGPTRDRADALNAVRSRLSAVATVEAADADVGSGASDAGGGPDQTGEPVQRLLTRARAVNADEIVLASDASVVAQLLDVAGRPVVVVPRP